MSADMGDVKLPDELDGSCDERFAGVADILAAQLRSGEHHGFAFAAYFRGEPVVDIWGGSRRSAHGDDSVDVPWERDTMAICWSTTKGIMAIALHAALERNGIALDAP